MASVKDFARESVSFQALFDEHSATIGKEAFQDKVVQDLMSSGERLQVDVAGDEVLVRKIDPDVSQGYNVFKNVGEYQTWLEQSLHEPGEDEVLRSMRENG